MPETTPLIKAALNLRVGVGFDVYLLTSPDSWITAIPTWKSVAPDTSGMPFTMPQNMSVTGIQHSLNIWQRNEPKANITMLLYPMPQRNW